MGGGEVAADWNLADFAKASSSPIRTYGYLGATGPENVILEKEQHVNYVAMVSEIDQAMKRHTGTLLHAVDGLSARLSQLESRTRQLEHSVDDLKVSIGNNHGNTDGKMRQMENILREVHSGMQDLKDKQEVMDAQMQLAKLHMLKVDQTPETQDSIQVEPAQQTASAPQHPNRQFPVACLQPCPAVPPNTPPLQQQIVNPPIHMLNQYPPTPMPSAPQQETYFPPPAHILEMSVPPVLQLVLQQQQQNFPLPPAASQHQQYELAPPTPYLQAPQLPQQQSQAAPVNEPPQRHRPLRGRDSDASCIPSQTSVQSLSASPSPSHMYDSPASRSGSGFSSFVYAPSTGPPGSYPYTYSGSSSHHLNNLAIDPQSHSASSRGNYPLIPTAGILPQAIPTASAVNSRTNSGGTGTRVPIDDVIGKVTNMGFPREHVRATVRKLTENGQPVDLNVVLDKLMNDGDVHPPRGWFGR